MSRKVAIIPARSGSKGLKNKNILELHGLPLYRYSIDFAIQSSFFDMIILTTDNEQILKWHEGDASLMVDKRLPKLATDNATIKDVVTNLYLNGALFKDDIVFLLQPTSPYRKFADLHIIHGLCETSNYAFSLCSVVKVDDHHPSRMYEIHDNVCHSIDAQNSSKIRQELRPLYLRNGCFYVSRLTSIIALGFTPPSFTPLVMPDERSINIDNVLDFKMAEIIGVPNFRT